MATGPWPPATRVASTRGSTYFHPDSGAAREAIACQVTLQRLAGGDALIGRLYPLLSAAGYEDVAVSPRRVYVDASRPGLVDGFTRRTSTAMIQGVRQAALSAGLIEPARFDEGVESPAPHHRIRWRLLLHLLQSHRKKLSPRYTVEPSDGGSPHDDR